MIGGVTTGGTTGGAAILPFVWAVGMAEDYCEDETVEQEMAGYRRSTEGMLRRYSQMSMESGRVPSLLGRELFRGHVSSYKVRGFDDVVIFVRDVEKCMAGLEILQQNVVTRIAMQGYTQFEAARLLRMSHRTVKRRYVEALDCLTRLFLELKLLKRERVVKGHDDADLAYVYDSKREESSETLAY